MLLRVGGALAIIRAVLLKLFKPFYILLLIVIIVPIVAGMYAWERIGAMAEYVLKPMNEKYEGLSIIPEHPQGMTFTDISFTGKDGARVTAVLAERDDSSDLTPVKKNEDIQPAQQIDYVLLCVDWDYGIRSSMELAEYLTAAGIRCVLWEPRAESNTRPYCTHGLKESEDVPLLIDALAAKCGKERPIIVAIGQRFGAGVLLKAAADDDRIRGIIAIDAFVSLHEALRRNMEDTLVNKIKLELIDFYITETVGFDCFNVAPAEFATNISRETPALAISMHDHPIHSLKDTLTIFRQLPSDTKEVWAIRSKDDPANATECLEKCLIGQGENERVYEFTLQLKDDKEAIYTGIVHWLQNQFLSAIDKPHINMPQQPAMPSRH